MSDRLCDVTVKRLMETPRAILVTAGGPEEGVWLPLSQVEVSPNAENPGLIDVTMPSWLAQERGLI